MLPLIKNISLNFRLCSSFLSPKKACINQDNIAGVKLAIGLTNAEVDVVISAESDVSFTPKHLAEAHRLPIHPEAIPTLLLAALGPPFFALGFVNCYLQMPNERN